MKLVIRTGCILLALAIFAIPTVAQDGTPTRVVVRAVANDAMILHDPVGGARITIRDAETDEVLAQGIQSGGAGSVEKIVRQPAARGTSQYNTPDAANYRTTLHLEEPTRVRITAEGPLDYPQAMQTASKSLLLVPGRDIGGDGVILTLHGFIVEILGPSASGLRPGNTVDVRSRVRMMCGCPTEPGGLWDANRYSIRAQILREGEVVAERPLSYTGESSTFGGTIQIPGQGAEQLRVIVSDARRVNFGLASRQITMND